VVRFCCHFSFALLKNKFLGEKSGLSDRNSGKETIARSSFNIRLLDYPHPFRVFRDFVAFLHYARP
jgi:hypothetical protein